MDSLDQFWVIILSGDQAQIRPVWETLSADERAGVRQHLGRMRTETGWHASQRETAEAALQAINALEPTA
jgi:hypothetical protein